MVLAAQEAVRRKDDGSGGEIPCELLEEKDSKKKMMMMKRRNYCQIKNMMKFVMC